MAGVRQDGWMAERSQTVVVDGRQLKLTNLDKVLYPAAGTTKSEVISYYAQVADVLLPQLWQRPVTRKRWPDGVGGPDDAANVFFAKDLPKGTPDWVRRYRIQHEGHSNDYPVVDDVATLTWLAQLASLELHVPQWRFSTDGVPQNPDRLVLDLDPGEGVSLEECAEVALWVRDVLAELGHEPVPVTSGSKGIHLYAPLDGTQTSEEASEFARQLALALQADNPKRVTASMARAERPGKVFIDWSQNNGNKTTVAPYSLRGRELPYVAAPRTWDELSSPGLKHLEYHEVLERIADLGDPMAALGGGGDRLATYRSMRDPAKTPEPVPATRPAAKTGAADLPTFVIQEHHARRLHYDVRLERDGVLVSWAVPKGPPTDPKENHLAVQTEDHPLEYGSFEGTIPAGEYGGGTVTIWDAGTYELEKWRDGREVIATLHGRPDGGLAGPAKFALIHTGSGEDDKNWLIHRMALERAPDEAGEPAGKTRKPAKKSPDAPAKDKGAATAHFADPLSPMLATLASRTDVSNEDDWAFEMKWDGIRTVAYLAGGAVRLLSRRGRDDTAAYPDLIDELAAIECEDAILDGEIVVTDASGAPRFSLLQPRINLTGAADIAAAAKKYPAQLMLFDLLLLDGKSLLRVPYEERRGLLEALVQPRPGARVQVPPVFDGDLAGALDTSLALDLEGVVAKRRGSTYLPGRRAGTWLKIKHRRTQSVVVGGWRPGKGRRAGSVGSLLLAVPEKDGLRYVGRAGSGFTDASLEEADRLLAPLARSDSPLVDVPREDARDARWVEPDLVGEVYYTEVTGTGRLRHPGWIGWRTDLTPADVRWETTR